MEEHDNYPMQATTRAEGEKEKEKGSGVNLDYSPQSRQISVSSSYDIRMVDYMLNEAPAAANNNVNMNQLLIPSYHQQNQEPISSSSNNTNNHMERTLSFADVMQFAEFGPKLALPQQQQQQEQEQEVISSGIDPVSFLKFPVLGNNDNIDGDGRGRDFGSDHEYIGVYNSISGGAVQQLENFIEKSMMEAGGGKSSSSSKRKRPRSIKTSEEVESQRMTHIAVERNRRKQMNEHLRVLRSLMPSSYVQRGDQASIIGGAIEFVRELEQLLQCLESQKRRRLYGGGGDQQQPTNQHHIVDDEHQLELVPSNNCTITNTTNDATLGILMQEETAESKSSIADVEVKVLGFDALIKILSRRRPGQLIKAIAALEDLHFSILHTNITTIEQTVLYSFNVKLGSHEPRFTAEDIATSVQQIFTFIHANTITIT